MALVFRAKLLEIFFKPQFVVQSALIFPFRQKEKNTANYMVVMASVNAGFGLAISHACQM